MDRVASLPRTVVRNGRRAVGAVQVQRISATGRAPTAVLEAVRAAILQRPNAEESAWIHRIELLRRLLAASPHELELEDFGAGSRRAGQVNTSVHEALVSTRTLGAMTASSKPPRWAYLLFRLVRGLRPRTCVELGACVGISASYQAAALECNAQGRLITLEGAPALAQRSERTLEELGLSRRAQVRQGTFADTLDAALTDLSPLDYAFIDGHHLEQATLDYAETILPALSSEAVLIFDDINWSDGMRRAWRSIETDDRYALTVDLRAVGLAVVSGTATDRRRLQVSYY